MTRKRSLAYFIAASVLAGQVNTLTDARIITLAESGLRVAELLRLIQRGTQVNFELTPTSTDAVLRAGLSAGAIRGRA
jgi:hypothetical protein